MNHKYIYFLMLLLFVASCTDNKKNDTTQKNETVPPLNNELVSKQIEKNIYLQYQFRKGEKFKYRIVTTSNNYQELVSDSTMRNETNQKVEYIISVNVQHVTNSGKAKLSFFVESIKVSGNINGQSISYDSKYIQSTAERLIFAQYEAIKKKSFTVDVNKAGKILKLYNTKKMTDELFAIQESRSKMTKKQKQELKQSFVEAALRPLAEQIFRKFPQEKLGIGSSWKEKYLSQLATFQIENIVTYQIAAVKTEEKDSVIVINAALSISWQGERNVTENGVTLHFYDPVVSGSGLVRFNNTKGITEYSQTTTTLELATDITGTDKNGKIIKAKRNDNSSTTNVVELLK